MRGRTILSYAYAVLTVCALVALVSCGGQKAATAAAAQPVVAGQKTASPGLVTFLSGEVSLRSGSAKRQAAIGDSLVQGTTIETGAQSFCEIQLSSKAVIRIDAKTQFVLAEASMTDGSSTIDLELKAGAVFSKVRKLAGNESFSVRTGSAACGVRGTEFLVRASDDKVSFLAVREGTVAFLPFAQSINALKAAAAGGGADLERMVNSLEGSALIVAAGTEYKPDARLLARSEPFFREMEGLVTRIKAAPDAPASKELLKRLETVSTEFIGLYRAPIDLTPRTKEELKVLDAMKFLEISAAGESGGIPKGFVKVSVRADQKDAAIFVDGVQVGLDAYVGLVKEGSTVAFSARKQGYADAGLTVQADPGKEQVYTIAMVAAAVQTPRHLVSLSVEPADATLYVNGEAVGTGRFERSYEEGSQLKLSIRRTDYAIQDAVATVSGPISRSFSLRKALSNKYKVSSERLVGELASSGTRLYAADGFGVVTALNSFGARQWTIPSGNNPNEQSFPVVDGRNLYFSGPADFIVADATSGALRAQVKLDEKRRHIFGQRVAVMGDICIYPIETGFWQVKPDTASFQTEFTIKDGLRSSPAVYEGRLLLVDQKGVLRAYGALNGAEQFAVQTSAVQPISAAVKVYGGKAFFSDRKGLVVAVDLTTRAVVWEKALDEARPVAIRFDLEVGAAGVFAAGGGRLYGLDAGTGARLFEPLANVITAPLLWGDRLFAGTRSQEIAVIDPATGSVLTTFGLDEAPSTRPFARGAELLVGTDKGSIFVLKP